MKNILWFRLFANVDSAIQSGPKVFEIFRIYMATPLGFEPRITPPKGAVLPLHHGVYGFAILDWPFSIQAQSAKSSDCASAKQLAEKIKVE